MLQNPTGQLSGAMCCAHFARSELLYLLSKIMLPTVLQAINNHVKAPRDGHHPKLCHFHQVIGHRYVPSSTTTHRNQHRADQLIWRVSLDLHIAKMQKTSSNCPL
ncbi:hypothetical protein SAY86_024628 [Trapa natans]|uniref:Uncharacterized protein n=1 Tax=Trapa natans TaxID=22666 RepID=A0AAN7RJW5_TRANT|nr:hypothetical protein SAY86_024628 [Trapa natans]